MWWIVALLSLAGIMLLSSLFALVTTRVPVVRTPVELLQPIVDAAGLQDGNVVVDAGCADGRTLLALCAAEGISGRGYELNGPIWLVGLVRVLFSGQGGRVKVFWRDFFRCELEDVDLVFCHLMPGSMGRVAEKCLAEMRPGSRLLSYLWEVPGWEPTQVVMLGPRQDPLFVYQLSATSPSGPKT